MKYIILLGDGMAGLPLKELDGKTTLERARTPNMDYMAGRGELGLARTVPDGLPPGSDVANLAVLGYDPKRYYSGRAPLEAASIGVELGPDDVAYRCNLVTLGLLDGRDGEDYRNDYLMEDFTARHIKTDEARGLIKIIDEHLGKGLGRNFEFYPGVSYRHLMVWKGGRYKLSCTPPHDITGKAIATHLPDGDGAETITGLMERSMDILGQHYEQGRREANSIWLWGQGKRPSMPSFMETYGLTGAMISAVDLMRGIAKILGLRVLDVPGATGWIDTDYTAKAEAALKALENDDFVYVHVEAPDESGHQGNYEYKLKAIEDFDEKVVGTVLNAIKGRPGYRVLVMPDHPTPIETKTHTSDPVPFILYDSGGETAPTGRVYTENSAGEAGVFIEEGWRLMALLAAPAA